MLTYQTFRTIERKYRSWNTVHDGDMHSAYMQYCNYYRATH